MKNILCIILASGLSTRFGDNKLMLPINKMTLFENTLCKFYNAGFKNVIVVIKNEELINLIKKYNFDYVINTNPERGQGFSIKLALGKGKKNNSFLFSVADMPNLNEVTLKSIVDKSLKHPDKIIRPICDDIKGNPVLFPHKYYEDLLKIKDNKGGCSVIKDLNEVCYIKINNLWEFKDIDTIEDYLTIVNKNIFIIETDLFINTNEYKLIKSNHNFTLFYNENYDKACNNIKVKVIDNIVDIFHLYFSEDFLFISHKIYEKLLSTKSNKIIFK